MRICQCSEGGGGGVPRAGSTGEASLPRWHQGMRAPEVTADRNSVLVWRRTQAAPQWAPPYNLDPIASPNTQHHVGSDPTNTLKETDIASFKEAYTQRARTVVSAGSGGQAKRRRTGEPGKVLPDGDISQCVAKSFLPPGTSIWRDRTRQGWCAHPKGHSRVSALWASCGGEQEALRVVLRQCLRVSGRTTAPSAVFFPPAPSPPGRWAAAAAAAAVRLLLRRAEAPLVDVQVHASNQGSLRLGRDSSVRSKEQAFVCALRASSPGARHHFELNVWRPRSIRGRGRRPCPTRANTHQEHPCLPFKALPGL